MSETSKIKGPDEIVNLVVLFKGGNHIVHPLPYKMAQNLLHEYRKFISYIYLSEEDRKKFVEKDGTPFLSFFYMHPESSKEKYKEDMFFIIDFSQVCGSYWYDVDKSKEELKKITEEEIQTRKDIVEIMKKQIDDQSRGEEWRGD